MTAYQDYIDKECIELQRLYSLPSSQSRVHFIAFAGLGQLADSDDIMSLKGIQGNTSIVQAFRRAIELCNSSGKSGVKKLTIVFISDGEDNNPEKCKRDIENLRGRMHCHSELICVGCKGFPTDFAAGQLFNIFGESNRRTLAPVVPCREVEDVPYAFSLVLEMLRTTKELHIATEMEVETMTDPHEIVKCCKVFYNCAVNGSLYFKDVSELNAFGDCKRKLALSLDRLKSFVRTSKRAGGRDILASVALKQKDLEACIHTVQGLERQASECLRMARIGQSVLNLSDDARLSIAGMASSKMTEKVLRYHLPDEERIMKSFCDFLVNYPDDPNAGACARDRLISTAFGVSLYDVLVDAKEALRPRTAVRVDKNFLTREVRQLDTAVFEGYPSFDLRVLLKTVPLMGYSVRIESLPEGALMNVWLIAVEGFGYSDVKYLQEMLLQDGPALARWNCMLLVPPSQNLADASWLKYVQTCLLFSKLDLGCQEFNSTVFHNESWWALLAACVEHWLKVSNYYTIPKFGSSTLAIDEAFRCFFPCVYPGARDYFELMNDDASFRDCLVSKHPELSPFINCPHLTKAVYAIWNNLHDPHVVKKCDQAQLRRRFLAFLVEFFHRAEQPLVWTPAVFHTTAEEVLTTWVCPTAASETGSLQPDFQRICDSCYAYGPSLCKALHAAWPVIQETLKKIKRTIHENPQAFFEIPSIDVDALNFTRHYQFTLQSIKNVFASLSRCIRCDTDADFSTALTQQELARILSLAQNPDNLLRNRDPSFEVPLTEEEFKHLACRKSIATLANRLDALARDIFVARYREESKKNHAEAPVRFDVGVVRGWQIRNGLDALGALDINPETGLSRAFCTCPSCVYFMEPLAKKAYTGQISPPLKAHLECLREIPGLHKILARYPRHDSEDSRDYVKRIARMIRGGGHIEKVHPSLVQIEVKIQQLSAGASSVYQFGKEARSRMEKLKRRRDFYYKNILDKFHHEYPEDEDVEQAVLQVLETRALTPLETFELLDKSKNLFSPLRAVDYRKIRTSDEIKILITARAQL